MLIHKILFVQETKIKGYLNIAGYKIITDEKVDPGKYGFKLVQENVTTHYFSNSSFESG